MQQVYWIKSSGTWTCPISGTWKVICVGGGSSGGIFDRTSNSYKQNIGGTTSFGNVISASGGGICQYYEIHKNIVCCGGYGGYDGINYGGSPAIMIEYGSNSYAIAGASLNGGVVGCQGIGFGAGGGSSSKDSGELALPGLCGDQIMTILDLTENQQIVCTVGDGGAAPAASNYDSEGTSGKRGVIYLEYLG